MLPRYRLIIPHPHHPPPPSPSTPITLHPPSLHRKDWAPLYGPETPCSCLPAVLAPPIRTSPPNLHPCGTRPPSASAPNTRYTFASSPSRCLRAPPWQLTTCRWLICNWRTTIPAPEVRCRLNRYTHSRVRLEISLRAK